MKLNNLLFEKGSMMTLDLEKIKAIAFDYGNTLIEFGPRQIEYQYKNLTDTLTSMFGNCNEERLKSIRDRQSIEPLYTDYRENDLGIITAELVNAIYDIIPSEEQVNELIKCRYDAFLRVVNLDGEVLPLLKKLKTRYHVALISNYPCGRTILDSLKQIGIDEVFDVTIVSGDVGYVKPHPKPFETFLNELQLHPERCVYVGDNWLADVQGSKRLGMHAVLTTQYVPYHTVEQNEDDYRPDAYIKNLTELENMLLP
jgi:putative hydrolase of the HAD superfamily